MRTTQHPQSSLGSRVSRRDLLASLGALLVAPRVMGQSGAKPPLKAIFLSNAMIAVSNLTRSIDFYQKLFGPAIQQGKVAIFNFGNGRFFGVTEATAGTKPGYLSYGMAIDNFDAERARQALRDLGAQGVELTTRGDTPELWALDPNGIKIQLQHPRYAHGSGPMGDVLPASPRAATAPPFAPKSYSHMCINIKYGPRSMDFYQKVLGLHHQALQGTAEMMALGPGPDFVAISPDANAPDANAGVNHCCFAIQNFDPQKVMGALIKIGLEPVETGRADPNMHGMVMAAKAMTCRVRWRQKDGNGGGPTSPMGTPELYFQDPDNIALQFSDVKYCGGSGFLGEICP